VDNIGLWNVASKRSTHGRQLVEELVQRDPVRPLVVDKEAGTLV
jgi:hypothetical protein